MFILYLLPGLSVPYLLRKERMLQDKQRAFIASSQNTATCLNEALKQLIDSGELSPSYICAVCGKHPISDNRYQVCASCKHRYRSEIQRVRTQNYRAKRAGLPATLTPVQWIQTVQKFGGLCAYCQQKPFKVLEHITPIAHQGGTTAENCVPACFACNAHKYADYPEEVL